MQPMDRICPFLALAADHRTVVDGFDPDHLCHALPEPELLGRARQVQLCLSETHRECERYVAALALRRAAEPSLPAPAPDARIARTRLIVEAEVPGRSVGVRERLTGAWPRRVALAGLVAVLAVLAMVSGAAEGFANFVGGPDPTVSPTPSPTVEVTPSPTPRPSETQPTPTPTPVPATPVPTPAPTPVPQATPRSYVVQQGDTLSAIAALFGTTVGAIQAANGLGQSDLINVGQVLVIP